MFDILLFHVTYDDETSLKRHISGEVLLAVKIKSRKKSRLRSNLYEKSISTVHQPPYSSLNKQLGTRHEHDFGDDGDGGGEGKTSSAYT